MNKLEFPLLMDALCQIGWNWPSSSEEEDLKFRRCYLLFRNYPRWKRMGSFTWTNLNPLHPRIENGQAVLEKKMKMWKIYDNNNNDDNDNNNGRRKTDKFWSEKLGWIKITSYINGLDIIHSLYKFFQKLSRRLIKGLSSVLMIRNFDANLLMTLNIIFRSMQAFKRNKSKSFSI